MSILNWLQSKLSRRGQTLTRYKKGMSKAKKGDFAGAIVDYSATIDARGIPNDVLGMALYNRALAYSAIHEDEKAGDDLTKVLGMPGLPDNIKVAASQRRERLRRREA
jgi:hypothetical protein